ncbi:flagellar biosynthetic protein FliO [Metabacillus sp. RGM 3146]|uniref:flagellar biosynthetic protein FliO n=1 Tax=Metabacillus sp. RGM 3146 TaxID=3401092 RepID=UPI003B9A1A7E
MFRKYLILSLLFAIITSFLIVSSPERAAAKEGDKSVQEWMNDNGKPAGTNSKDTKVTDNSGSDNSQSASLTFMDFVKMIFATLLVVALIYFLLKWINRKNRLVHSVHYLENMGGTSLGTNRSIQLVKVGERILVVGVGENIQLIKEISDQEEVAKIMEMHGEKESQLPDMKNVLKRFTSLQKPEQQASHSSFAVSLKKQIEQMKQERKDKTEVLKKKGKGL